MAWKSGAFPTTFAVIGDSLPKNRRAVAFSVQSILIRLPRVIGAPLGGLLIVSAGMVAGIRTSVTITIGLALIVLVVQFFGFREEGPARPGAAARELPRGVRRNAGQAHATADGGMPDSNRRSRRRVVHHSGTSQKNARSRQRRTGCSTPSSRAFRSPRSFPGGRMADLSGRRPIVALTFVFFATFPLAVRFAPEFSVARGGVRDWRPEGDWRTGQEVLDRRPLARRSPRARTVGVYYTIRNLLVVPAGALGGLLWQRARHLPLEVACAIGAVGVIVFLMTPDDRTSDIR